MGNVSATIALKTLKDGNERYRTDRDEHPRNDAAYRATLADGQRPFASILTCSDSRVPPELVFDQGLGDLFVIRVAGNIVDDAVLGSLEFASLQLGVQLIVVMGHRNCGAVAAAVDNVNVSGPDVVGHIDALVESIRPAALADGSHSYESCARTNAIMVADKIRTSEPVLSGLVSEGIQVVAAYYDVETGHVEWLDQD